MIRRLVGFALHQRFIVLALALLLTAMGLASFYRLPIEAYPDVADVQVDLITIWPGHAAEEVERLITISFEKELNGIANVTFLRSISNFGMSNIRVVFGDGTGNYWARQQVQERIGQADLPPDAKPQLGPLSSVIGEVYRYTLESKTMPLYELKALEDWTLEREFRKVPGVVDVTSRGGGIKQYQVTVDPARLRASKGWHTVEARRQAARCSWRACRPRGSIRGESTWVHIKEFGRHRRAAGRAPREGSRGRSRSSPLSAP